MNVLLDVQFSCLFPAERIDINIMEPMVICYLIIIFLFRTQIFVYLLCSIYTLFFLSRLSSPAVRVPRAASSAAVEVDSIAYHKTLDELPCSTVYTLVSRTGALATLIQFLPRKL